MPVQTSCTVSDSRFAMSRRPAHVSGSSRTLVRRLPITMLCVSSEDIRPIPLRPAVCASVEGGSLGGHLLRGSLPELRTTQKRRITNERSEEHTSELQSLMRISYAVFCLKKN